MSETLTEICVIDFGKNTFELHVHVSDAGNTGHSLYERSGGLGNLTEAEKALLTGRIDAERARAQAKMAYLLSDAGDIGAGDADPPRPVAKRAALARAPGFRFRRLIGLLCTPKTREHLLEPYHAEALCEYQRHLACQDNAGARRIKYRMYWDMVLMVFGNVLSKAFYLAVEAVFKSASSRDE